MQVVAREEDHISGPEGEGLSTLDTHVDVPLDDVVIGHQVGRGAEHRGAMLGLHARRHAPGCAELGMQEHAAREIGDPQDVR